MKTIAVIVALIALCSLASGYEVGDTVYLAVQSLGVPIGSFIGNITSIEDDLICINCTATMDMGEEPVNVDPSELCIAKNTLYALRSID